MSQEAADAAVVVLRQAMTKQEALKRARQVRWAGKTVNINGVDLSLRTVRDAKRILAVVLQRGFTGDLSPSQTTALTKVITEFTRAVQVQQDQKVIRRLRRQVRALQSELRSSK